jgi:hypothetical protein
MSRGARKGEKFKNDFRGARKGQKIKKMTSAEREKDKKLKKRLPRSAKRAKN